MLFIGGSGLSTLAFTVIVLARLSDAAPMNALVTKDRFHDLGKLQFAFVMLWTYFNFSQYLQDNVAEAVSGVKGENSIKLFGSDLRTLVETGDNKKTQACGTCHGPGLRGLASIANTGIAAFGPGASRMNGRTSTPAVLPSRSTKFTCR